MADARNGLETVKQDTADLADEAKERTQSAGERVNRAVQGDSMPLGDRIASHVKEAGHDLKAEVDRSKRDIRNNT
jgi:hypothetical protein